MKMFLIGVLIMFASACSSITEEEYREAIKESFTAGYKAGHMQGCDSAMEYANIIDDMGVCHVMTEAQVELIQIKVEETKL
jgi:hypothetical protein